MSASTEALEQEVKDLRQDVAALRKALREEKAKRKAEAQDKKKKRQRDKKRRKKKDDAPQGDDA